MSDKNRKDSEISLPDMREMFEHYTSVEDDEKPAEQNEMEKIAHKYLDGGDAQTEDETRHESAAAPEEERQEPVGVSDLENGGGFGYFRARGQAVRRAEAGQCL